MLNICKHKYLSHFISLSFHSSQIHTHFSYFIARMPFFQAFGASYIRVSTCNFMYMYVIVISNFFVSHFNWIYVLCILVCICVCMCVCSLLLSHFHLIMFTCHKFLPPHIYINNMHIFSILKIKYLQFPLAILYL